ncbi:MAG: hypothetical protein D6E12_03125 [Desulfovibrio sp.]|nr:MAG: hypothetical protein D6E12_03125 [Desulfovibrio sp.]
MDKDRIQKALFKRYLLMLAPAALIFIGWGVYRVLQEPGPLAPPEVIGPIAFIGAVVVALALPLFIRGWFVKKVGESTSVEAKPFLAFESTLLSVALVSPYFAALAYICSTSMFHFGGAFLAALYAAYYYFPTKARVAHEMRLFRVG